ncbi:MAG: hypothetical protein Q6368_005980 [Candidatus Baldrarchaeota archaeon]
MAFKFHLGEYRDMIKVEEVNNVFAIKCGNEINGRVLYWTTLILL